MSGNFHENYLAGNVSPPSNRSVGVVLAALFYLLAYKARLNNPLFALASILATSLLCISLIRPDIIRPLSVIWFRLGLVMGKIMTPIVMLLLFIVVILPIGLLVRYIKDPLQLRRNSAASSYWVMTARQDHQDSMRDQF